MIEDDSQEKSDSDEQGPVDPNCSSVDNDQYGASSGSQESADPDEVRGSHVERGPGDGAMSASEDWVRANRGPISHDGRGITRTTFYSSDTERNGPGQKHRDPDDRRSWADLAKWNDGMHSKDVSRGGQNFKADKRRWVETFASQLNCTDFQEERAQYILGEIDLVPFTAAHIATEKVIVGIFTLVIDTEVDTFEHRAINREEMQELMADLGMDRRDIVDIRQKIHRYHPELVPS